MERMHNKNKIQINKQMNCTQKIDRTYAERRRNTVVTKANHEYKQITYKHKKYRIQLGHRPNTDKKLTTNITKKHINTNNDKFQIENENKQKQTQTERRQKKIECREKSDRSRMHAHRQATDKTQMGHIQKTEGA